MTKTSLKLFQFISAAEVHHGRWCLFISCSFSPYFCVENPHTEEAFFSCSLIHYSTAGSSTCFNLLDLYLCQMSYLK